MFFRFEFMVLARLNGAVAHRQHEVLTGYVGSRKSALIRQLFLTLDSHDDTAGPSTI